MFHQLRRGFVVRHRATIANLFRPCRDSFGLRVVYPTDESVGYCRASLRDEDLVRRWAVVVGVSWDCLVRIRSSNALAGS